LKKLRIDQVANGYIITTECYGHHTGHVIDDSKVYVANTIVDTCHLIEELLRDKKDESKQTTR